MGSEHGGCPDRTCMSSCGNVPPIRICRPSLTFSLARRSISCEHARHRAARHLHLYRQRSSRPLGDLPARVAVSVVTLGELCCTPPPPRREPGEPTRRSLARAAEPIPISEAIMIAWARLVADCGAADVHRMVNTDALIAATAVKHGLPVVTQDADYDDIAPAHPRCMSSTSDRRAPLAPSGRQATGTSELGIGRARASARRDVIPSLVKTWCMCHSTVRGLRKRLPDPGGLQA